MKLIGFSTDDLKNISVLQALEIIKLHNHIKKQEIQELEANQKQKNKATQKEINMLFS